MVHATQCEDALQCLGRAKTWVLNCLTSFLKEQCLTGAVHVDLT